MNITQFSSFHRIYGYNNISGNISIIPEKSARDMLMQSINMLVYTLYRNLFHVSFGLPIMSSTEFHQEDEDQNEEKKLIVFLHLSSFTKRNICILFSLFVT